MTTDIKTLIICSPEIRNNRGYVALAYYHANRDEINIEIAADG